MKDHPVGRMHQRSIVFLAAAVFCALCGRAGAQDVEYIQDDVKISGKTINAFADGDEQATVVTGGFTLEMGKRTITGQEAVLWVKEIKAGTTIRRDIVIYVRGNARVTEPNGAVTSDRAMLVKLHQQGSLRAQGRMSDQALLKDPLYVEAKEVRRTGKLPEEMWANGPTSWPATEVAPAATGPAPTAAPATGPASRPTTLPATAPAKSNIPDEVSFRNEGTIYVEEIGLNRHVIIVRGNVYITQGNPKSHLLLELRCQSAVLYTEPIDPKPKGEGRMAPRIVGLPTGTGGTGEGLAGVYLEDDVIINRGERSMQAPAAFYDFKADKALVLDPVLRQVHPTRNVPMYVRAKEARLLSPTETLFTDAKVTTSDFFSPDYHMGTSKLYVKDTTPMDATGQVVGQSSFHGTFVDETFNLYGVPLLYWPRSEGDFTEEPTALRRGTIGKQRDFGFGIQTQWDLFRLVGLAKPEGFRGTFDFEAYEEGLLAGANVTYARQQEGRQYSGYANVYGVLDTKGTDNLGHDRSNVPAPEDRSWVQWRHKELLPQDVQLQFEFSYISDRNFLERFFPDEYFAGKEQETLLYAKKQGDQWAVTSLLQARINPFLTQTESWPDLGFYVEGQPLADDNLLFFSENHLGLKRWRPDNSLPVQESDVMARGDTRDELDLPLHAGPINLVPYGVGRGTFWTDTPDGSSEGRPYGQAGIKANTHIWRVYENAESRLFDVHKLKHIMTPEATAFFSGDGDVGPTDLFPMDPGIEQHVGQLNGGTIGLYQRLQTKRGPAGNLFTVDWMRLDVVAGFFNTNDLPQQNQPADGRFFFTRPEDSIPRDFVNADYLWNISDSTSLLADTNYDLKSAGFGRNDVGIAIQRDPRLRYYFGWRYIRDLNASVGTFGVDYQLSRKYSLAFFEQYDFKFSNGENLATNISIIRKFPRWYGAFTFTFDQRTNETALYITFWPEGFPEVKLGGERLSLLAGSSNN